MSGSKGRKDDDRHKQKRGKQHFWGGTKRLVELRAISPGC